MLRKEISNKIKNLRQSLHSGKVKNIIDRIQIYIIIPIFLTKYAKLVLFHAFMAILAATRGFTLVTLGGTDLQRKDDSYSVEIAIII